MNLGHAPQFVKLMTTLVKGNPHPGAIRQPPPGTVGRGEPRATGVMPEMLVCPRCGESMHLKTSPKWGRRFICPGKECPSISVGKRPKKADEDDSLPIWKSLKHILIEEPMSKSDQRPMNRKERVPVEREVARRVAVMRQFVVARVMAHSKHMAAIARDAAGHWKEAG